MTPATMDSATKLVSEKYPKQHDTYIQYGTAGFRTKGDLLSHVMCRMGLLAALRSKVKKATIGVMITASHNPEQDNGVKLVDPLGEMLEMRWEKHATVLANVSDGQLAETLASIAEEEKVDLEAPASVFIARDTRPSSLPLSQSLQCGIEAMKASFQDFGLLTTPQLHYLVRCKNTAGAYGQFTEEGYYTKLSNAFIKLQKSIANTGNYSSDLYLDCANGVGGQKVKLMAKYLCEALNIDVRNDGTSGKLNYKCGADYVKVNQCPPEGFTMTEGMKCASYDGDGDRLVYYCYSKDGKFHLMDGDRIATLVGGYLQKLVQNSGLQLNLGLVQTAYTNGSATRYITDTLRVPVACVATGVKHLHKKALEYDVGVYFEANGHGTVIFKEEAENRIRAAASDSSLSDDQRQSADKLVTTIDLINQAVGDAISDMLLVEVILCSQGWNVEDWSACYTNLPNRLKTVKVKDRSIITTTVDERQATSPDGLQTAIDAVVAKYSQARSFVRPSGTEDLVRVYAEADTQASTDELAYEVCMVVYNLAGGIGDKPTPP